MKIKLNSNSYITEKMYRNLKERLSYSTLKIYNKDRKKFYNEIILGNKKEDEEQSYSLVLGSLVHCLLAGKKDDFDNRYHILEAIEPGGQVKELADTLFVRYCKTLYDDIQKDEFSVIFNDAFNIVKYEADGKTEKAFKNKTVEKALELFEKTGKAYFEEKLKCIGKECITPYTITQAEEIVKKVKNHKYTNHIFTVEDNVEVFSELPILFTLYGLEFKSMVDRLHVDHTNKTITPYDWKTAWDMDNPIRVYLKMSYYLQAGLYALAVIEWQKQHPELQDYDIKAMKFVFIDPKNFVDPVVLELLWEDVYNALHGFTIGNYSYEGVVDIVKSIKWHIDNATWTTTKELDANNGVIYAKLNYTTNG